MERVFLLNLSEWLGVIAIIQLLGMSTRYRRPPLGFRFPAREGKVSLGLYILILLLAVLYYGDSFGAALKTSPGPDMLWPRLALAGLSLLPVLAALLIRRQPPRSAGWERVSSGAAMRAALVLIFLVIILRGQVFSFLKDFNQADAILFLGWVGLSLAEETIFRGYIQPRLAAWMGVWQGIITTALLFTLWNLPRLLMSADLLFNLGITLVNGLLLGWLMRRTGNVLASGLYRAVSEWLRLVV